MEIQADDFFGNLDGRVTSMETSLFRLFEHGESTGRNIQAQAQKQANNAESARAEEKMNAWSGLHDPATRFLVHKSIAPKNVLIKCTHGPDILHEPFHEFYAWSS